MSSCKECPDCSRVLSLDNFTKNKASKDDKCRYCRNCAAIRVKNSVSKYVNRGKIVESKVCGTCHKLVEASGFHKNSTTSDRLAKSCKQCKKDWYSKNKEKLKDKYQQNRDKLIEYQKRWNACNGDKKRQANARHRSKIRTMLEKVLFGNARSRYLSVMSGKGIQVTISFKELIECTDVELFFRFEAMFKDGMHEGNYGTEWEIDHIRPICSFDLTKEEDLRKCFHYSNLQPLWKEENWMKGTSYTPE